MKKITILSLAILLLFACSKNESSVEEQSFITLGASIEQTSPTLKANLNGSLETLWATGDIIKVYVSNNSNTWNTVADFRLISGEGTANGVFRSNDDYSDGNHWDWYAFFPYYYTASDGVANTDTNMGGDGFYFCLPNAYYSYTSGQSFLPLLADLTGGSAQPSSISFKHVGGAVVVNLTGVPGAAKSLGMTVAGKNIYGWPGKVNLSEVGTADGKITASDGSNSTVWMNFATAEADRDFQFIFPVPTIASTSDLTFTMYDSNNLKIWQKTASNQPAIGRAEALVMPEKSVSPIPYDIYLAGWINNADVYTTIDDTYKFVNGSLNLNLTSDSYILLNFTNDGSEAGNIRYLLPAYEESATSATFSTEYNDYNNKLKVPAGNRTFTLSYNTTGTITLSYQ